MKSRQTTLNIKIKKNNKIGNYKRGIFHTRYGYNITGDYNYAITLLLYVDDLKLYANTKHKLDYLLKATERYTRDINLAFRLEKCRISIAKGKYTIEKSYKTEGKQMIQL